MSTDGIISAIVPRGAYVKPHGWGLEIAKATPYDVLGNVLDHLSAFHRKASGIQFVIGDAVLFAEEHYGEEAHQMFSDSRLSYSYLRDAKWMARKFSPDERLIDKGLSFSHHKSVASLPLGDREELLRRAISEGLNRDELEVEVKVWKAEHPEKEEPSRTPPGGRQSDGNSGGTTTPPDTENDTTGAADGEIAHANNRCTECGGKMVIAPCPHCFERVFVCTCCHSLLFFS